MQAIRWSICAQEIVLHDVKNTRILAKCYAQCHVDRLQNTHSSAQTTQTSSEGAELYAISLLLNIIRRCIQTLHHLF